MKVGILTWYKELNHGAVLQAYASQEFLKQNGYSPVIVDYERKTSNNLGVLESTRKRLKRLFSGDYKYNGDYEKYKTIKKQCFSNFSESAFDHISSISDQYDCIMIGSDMVFSLIQGFSPYMFGIGIDSKYIFSYAACSGGTKYKLVARLGLIQQIENG